MYKTRKLRKCEKCRTEPAVYAMQYLDGEHGYPFFYLLGWHVRGFSLTPVCPDCKDAIERQSHLPALRVDQ